MSKLEDMEELILKVKNKNFKPTLQEIISCYYAGAYRACIVLSFNILVDDLVEKIKHLKDTNSELRKIYSEILKKNQESTPIENYLVESLLSKNLIDNLDGELYTIFQKLRHKSAHPTGFSPSAECARYVFSEIVNRFLSKESLQTTSRIDELIESLKNGNFFPTNSIKDGASIAKSEIQDIAPQSYPQLINKSYKEYLRLGDKPNNSYLKFITALSAIGDEEINSIIIKNIIKKHSSRSDNNTLFVSLITSNSLMFESIDITVATRLFSILKNTIKNSSPMKPRLNSLSNPHRAILCVFNNARGNLREILLKNINILLNDASILTFFIGNLDMTKDSLGIEAYLKLYDEIIKKIEKKDIATIIESIENDDSGAYKRIYGEKLIKIILGIIECCEGDKKKAKDFVYMLCIHHGDIIDRIKKYINDKKQSIASIKNKNTNISEWTFKIFFDFFLKEDIDFNEKAL